MGERRYCSRFFEEGKFVAHYFRDIRWVLRLPPVSGQNSGLGFPGGGGSEMGYGLGGQWAEYATPQAVEIGVR